ncbi:hypothetical protein BU24DRAFT_426033 [Aaosphaeria arxii CBS 175.79]|uniref:Uncharacterized protein n=1 Tax=Aaosphaeria arxii CBS 175.79 TaxID=1450172 RepID=A0A6A5XH03_9PLEO|nr:uncharacterized protein BU24DRAFT_426033 [Aaosphaeria arxii CBS 175.79]KAF2012190.1 hypothetical protein BU24DRAFT_426033 [Aaosphaeria arxii CBS 175.79]
MKNDHSHSYLSHTRLRPDMPGVTSPEPLLPLGEALAQVDPHRIYEEARRQYEVLIRTRESQPSLTKSRAATKRRNTRTTHTNPANNPRTINLSKYYRDLFFAATPALDAGNTYRLLTVCLAYKTKARVLQYLELLQGAPVSWLIPLKDIIEACATDSEFDDFDSVNGRHLVALDNNGWQAGRSRRLASSSASSAGSDTSARPSRKIQDNIAESFDLPTGQTGPRRPQFIISTLPLAFPSIFFTALAQHAPKSCLTATTLLSHPAAYLLGLADLLKARLRNEHTASQQSSTRSTRSGRTARSEHHSSPEDGLDSEDDFLIHLSGGKEKLRQPNMHAMLPKHAEGGYDIPDLDRWCRMWKTERSSSREEEKSQKIPIKMTQRTARQRPAIDMKTAREARTQARPTRPRKDSDLDLGPRRITRRNSERSSLREGVADINRKRVDREANEVNRAKEDASSKRVLRNKKLRRG